MQFCGTHRKNCRTRKKPVNALQNRLPGKKERITENFAVEPRCVRQKCRNYAGSSVPAHCGAGKNIKWSGISGDLSNLGKTIGKAFEGFHKRNRICELSGFC